MSCWKSSDYKAGSCHRKTSDSFTHFPSLHMARCSMWLRHPKKVIKVFQYEQPWVNSEIWWSNSIHENIENRGNTNRKQPFIIHIPSLPQPPSPIHTGFACATLLWLKRWPPPSSIWCFPSCLSFQRYRTIRCKEIDWKMKTDNVTTKVKQSSWSPINHNWKASCRQRPSFLASFDR